MGGRQMVSRAKALPAPDPGRFRSGPVFLRRRDDIALLRQAARAPQTRAGGGSVSWEDRTPPENRTRARWRGQAPLARIASRAGGPGPGHAVDHRPAGSRQPAMTIRKFA